MRMNHIILLLLAAIILALFGAAAMGIVEPYTAGGYAGLIFAMLVGSLIVSYFVDVERARQEDQNEQ